VRGRVPIIVDGGIRRSADVLKAPALARAPIGADAVLLGRPVLYALARMGQVSVEEALRMIQREFRLLLILAGCVDVAAVTWEIVVHVSSGSRGDNQALGECHQTDMGEHKSV
jgi:4-hydroxymandelate oxidase